MRLFSTTVDFNRLFAVPYPIDNRGVVLITVLWTTMLLTIMVAAMASSVRIGAQSAYYYERSAHRLAAEISAVNMAEMELMLSRMPRPPAVDKGERSRRLTRGGALKKEAYRFNGDTISLHYPLPKTVGVRICDNAGMINMRRLTKRKMRRILEKILQGEKESGRINDLLNSWQDWIDSDDLVRVGGAEKEYYQSLKNPYLPANAPLQTVDELLLVKGFADVFAGINIRAAFTMYGDNDRINVNLATREALLLVPGLSEKEVDRIIALRREKEIKNLKDLVRIVDPAHFAQAKSWFSMRTSNYYTIYVYPHADESSLEKDKSPAKDKGKKDGIEDAADTWGYAETVRVHGYARPPDVLRVDPLVRLPVCVDCVRDRDLTGNKVNHF